MTRDAKRVILHAFIDHVEATPYDKHGLHLFVCWRDGTKDRVSIPRLPTYGDAWLLEQHERLLHLLDAHATQEEIAAAFPQRTWRVIRDRITRTRGLKAALFTPKPIRDFETYTDFLKRTESAPQSLKALHRWRSDEIKQLLEMLEQGATKMDIAQAFPYRIWTRLRAKISELKGKEFEVLGDMPIGYKESYIMYQQRLAEEQGEDTSRMSVPTTETDDESTRITDSSRCLRWKARRRG